MAPPNGGDDSINGDSRDRDMHHCEDVVVHTDRRVVVRGKNTGKGLDIMSRGGRLPLEILPGRTRPTSVVIAAKFTTECGLTVRSQMQIVPYWKEYKLKPELRAEFYGKVGQKFVMDEENPYVQHACDNHLMKQQRNQRYILKKKKKKKYFDPFPLKNKTCAINSENRKSVKYPAVTGSRSYEVFCNGGEDDVELFKKTHIIPNLKSRYRDNVNKAIVSHSQFLPSLPSLCTCLPPWKQKIAPACSEDGSMDEPLSSIEAMHQVLTEDKRKPTFLKNIGIPVACTSRMPKSQLQVQLEAEKEGNNKLLSIIEELHKSKETAEAERVKYAEDMQEMRNIQEDMEKKKDESNALLKQLLAQLSQQQH
ncbi:hypothetical protein ACQ4PT_045784 [Festuca glaucescens]